MHRDNSAVGAFTERLAPEGGQRDLHCIRVPTDRDKPLGEYLQGVKAQLAQPLPLEKDPLVTPVGQKLTSGQRMPHVVVVDLVRRIAHPARPQDRLSFESSQSAPATWLRRTGCS